MLFERVEAVAPQRAVGGEPFVDVAQRLGPDAVEPPLGVDARLHHAGVAQHAQVLRDRRLARVQSLHQLVDGPLALSEQVEDAATARLGEDGEGGHV